MNTAGKIGLGTVQFGIPYGISNKSGQTSHAEVTFILNYAKEQGIDILDTASAYGTSEKVLGQNNLECFKVVSKFLIQNSEQSISTQLYTSLKLLNINSLYAYMAHRALDIVNHPELWYELNKFREKGFIKKIGFSFNEINEMDAVLAAGFSPDIIQIPYNYLDKRFQAYMIDLKSKGCEIHTRSPFLQGLFFSDTSGLNPFFNEVKPVLAQLQEYGPDLPGMLLKHCMEKPFVDKVIFGVNTLAQIKENIRSMMNAENLPLNEKEVNESILIPSKWPK